MQDFEKLLAEQLKAEQKKKQFQEWGKLGGRPKKNKKKSKVISLRFTEEEFEKIELDFSESKIKNFTDFCRKRIQNKNTETYFDFIELKKQFIEQTNNFIRLKNFIQSGIFNSEEKKYFMEELEQTIKKNRKSLEWLEEHFA